MRHLKSTSGLAAVLAITACSHTTFQSSTTGATPPAVTQPLEPLATPPAPLPLEPIEFPPFHERTFANGARVIVVANHEQPVVSVSVTIRGAGSVADPQGKAGVAALTADLLTMGTATRNAKEIAETIDFVGGQLAVTASEDWTTLQTTVLTDFLETALTVLTDVMMHPTFLAAEVEHTRKQMLAGLEAASGQPESLAERRFRQEVYGAHPYGQVTTPASISAITRQDVVAFHQSFYRPSQALITVAGDVEPAAIVTWLERALAKWAPGDSPAEHVAALPPWPVQAERRLVFVDKPGSVQAVYRIGQRLPPASNTDWVGLSVMQVILGGPAGSLTHLLREQKGYTYAAYAIPQELEHAGSLMISTEVRNEVADGALADVLRLLEQLGRESVQQDELTSAKDAMTGGFPIGIETPQQVAIQVANTLLLGRPVDYLKSFRTQVAATTPADIERVAHEYLTPESLVIVVVGDAAQLLEKLRPFAHVVELYDVRGRPLAPRKADRAP